MILMPAGYVTAVIGGHRFALWLGDAGRAFLSIAMTKEPHRTRTRRVLWVRCPDIESWPLDRCGFPLRRAALEGKRASDYARGPAVKRWIARYSQHAVLTVAIGRRVLH